MQIEVQKFISFKMFSDYVRFQMHIEISKVCEKAMIKTDALAREEACRNKLIAAAAAQNTFWSIAQIFKKHYTSSKSNEKLSPNSL